jgi:hypothetical protein
VDYDKLPDDRLGEPSADIRGRVEKAREVQLQRFAGVAGGSDGQLTLLCNADTLAPALQVQVWALPKSASTARWTMRAGACCAPP